MTNNDNEGKDLEKKLKESENSFDITDRKSAEQKLKESEKRLIYAQKIASLGFWDLNIITGELYWSDETYRIFGFKPQEFIATYEKFRSVVHPEDLEVVQMHVDAALLDDVKYNIDFRIVQPSGEIRYVNAQGDVTRDSKGKAIRFVGTQIDITERKIAEQKLKESEERLKYIISSNPAVIYTSKTSGDYGATFISEKICELTGYTTEDFITNSEFWSNKIHPDDRERIMSELTALFERGSHSHEYRFQFKDGTYHWIRDELNLIRDEKGNPIETIGFMIDITNRKIAEQNLKESEDKYKNLSNELEQRVIERTKELKESEKMYRDAYERAEFYKDLFAHDISNILQNVKSSLGLLSVWRNVPEKIDNIDEIMNIINDQIIRGSKLVSNIRKLSEISEAESLVESVEVFQIIKDAIKFIHKSFPERDINIEIDSQIKEANVKANQLLLDVFENILFNGIKYNENLRVEFHTKISREIRDDTKYVKIEFIDNGIGIPDVMKERIFKGISNRKEKVHGMGLGLLLVKNLLTIYNGDIWVEDKVQGDPSQGSNFIVLIPEVI